MRPFRKGLLALVLTTTLSAFAAPIVTLVDAANDAGMDSSLQMNGGNPVVSYYSNAGFRVATCTSGCGTATPSWAISTVDETTGNTGFYSSLQLVAGRPVAAYFDRANGDLKLATCTANCASSSASWVVTTVDGTGDVGLFPSLKFNGGNPVISYRDLTLGDLKLATCTANCASASPSWVITTIDSAGDTGRYTSLQFRDGKPVVSYYDVTNGRVKLATCTADCATGAATWIITVVDEAPFGDDWRFSMQLNSSGNPVISYHDRPRNALKIATCTAACATASPAWTIATVESSSDLLAPIGHWSSLQLRNDRPVIAYWGGRRELTLAACTAGCATATPTWSISAVDPSTEGWYPSLQLDGSRAFITYYAWEGDLKMAVVELDAPAAANYTAFWWNPAESGWGMHLTHGGNTLFALLYTYAMDGAPMWLAASNLVLQADGSYSGALARYSGPPFNQVPWGTATPTTVGTMTLRFAGSDSATLTYSVDGIPVAKTIRPYIYAANTVCVSGSPQRASAANYQDLWWNPAESGWGLALAHQGNILFGGLFTYSSAGRSVWYVASALTRQLDGSFSGDLGSFTGPPFNASPWTPFTVSTAGPMTLRFSDGEHGTLSYSVFGVPVTKSIVRYVFASTAPVCN